MRRLLLILIAMAVLTGTAPLRAQDTIEEARAQQEQARREAAAAAGELDLLAAQDEDVATALADLDAFIAQTEADIEAAEQAILAAERASQRADAEAVRIAGEVAGLELLLRDRAVDAYVLSGDGQLEILLGSSDPAVAELREFLLSVANGETTDVADRLRDAEDDQRDAESEADQARAVAEAERAQIATHLDELERARAQQAEIKADIERRISEWETEIDVLNAVDAELTAFIVAEQQRIAAAEEARRRAEEEARRQAEEEARRQAEEEARRQAEEEAQQDQQDQPDQDPTDEPTGDQPPGTFVRPHGGVLTSPFGWRIHPIFGVEKFHTGIDINGSMGDPIVASAGGIVISAGSMGGYGNVVIIDHGAGISTLYAHQSTVASSVGQQVGQGEIIGYVGSTGYSTGPHLHFEVRVDGVAVDPMLYI